MGTRKSAADLTDAEIDSFVNAVTTMKQSGEYDRFVALHGAVMRIEVRFASGAVQRTNMAHWNIGFCPWHRQYLLAFEQALQNIDSTVDLPYWDWADPTAATGSLFADRLAGSLGPNTGPVPVADGRFAPFPIDPQLAEIWGSPLQRGGGLSTSWPPSTTALDWLENLRFSAGGSHPLWIFWRILEAGWPNALTATHNAAHNFVGGHMSGTFSPNDPVFWLHHANVDRIWARWQANYPGDAQGGDPIDWPDPVERSPLDGQPAPYGHRLNDLMWPWVGDSAAAFTSLSATPGEQVLIEPLVGNAAVRVLDVLDIDSLGYDYAN